MQLGSPIVPSGYRVVWRTPRLTGAKSWRAWRPSTRSRSTSFAEDIGRNYAPGESSKSSTDPPPRGVDLLDSHLKRRGTPPRPPRRSSSSFAAENASTPTQCPSHTLVNYRDDFR
jgi:hypothetical protein